jgi:DNA recombination protein RmuC
VATPTTLLTSLNIVRQLWRFEEQNNNTADLIDRAAKIYRKLVTFLESMETLGRQIDTVKTSYDKALGQLYLGRGNLISQAKHFETLGVSTKSALPEAIASRAMLELDLDLPPDAPDAPKAPDTSDASEAADAPAAPDAKAQSD